MQCGGDHAVVAGAGHTHDHRNDLRVDQIQLLAVDHRYHWDLITSQIGAALQKYL